MTDRTVLKKIFGCKDNGIDFITGLDEAIFEEAFSRMKKEPDMKGSGLECMVICVKFILIEKLEEMLLEYGEDEDKTDRAITVRGMCPYDDIRCEILPDDTPILYIDKREEYERKFKEDIITNLEMMTHIRLNERQR